jgi:hypothetical protein
VKFGKQWSAPHFAWLLTLNGEPMQWTSFLMDPLKRACIGADAFPVAPWVPIIFAKEADIDKVLAALDGM